MSYGGLYSPYIPDGRLRRFCDSNGGVSYGRFKCSAETFRPCDCDIDGLHHVTYLLRYHICEPCPNGLSDMWYPGRFDSVNGARSFRSTSRVCSDFGFLSHGTSA